MAVGRPQGPHAGPHPQDPHITPVWGPRPLTQHHSPQHNPIPQYICVKPKCNIDPALINFWMVQYSFKCCVFTMSFCSICTIIRLLILKSTHNKVMKPVVAKRTQTFKYWRAKSPIGVKSTKMFWLLVKTNSSTALSRIWLNTTTTKNFVWQHYVNSKKLKAINGQLSRPNNKSVTFPSWSYFRLNRLFL